jgi:phosphatidylglycerol---prolipoprotein diacylglyceryl transferase
MLRLSVSEPETDSYTRAFPMWQELIRLPMPFDVPVLGRELVVHGFGLMLVVGFLCAIELLRFLARRSGLDPDVFSNAALIGLATGILGARLSHVFENFAEYTRADRSFFQNVVAAANISSGGLTYYGGFLLAFPTLLVYGWIKRMPLRAGMDIVAPCLVVGLAFGRIGCFLNGCCYGAPCEAAWGVAFPYGSPAYVDQFNKGEIIPPERLIVARADGKPSLVEKRELRDPEYTTADRAIAAQQHSLPVHPAQLYSAFTAFLLTAVLVAHLTTPHAPGRTFALMLILESFARFSLELLRSEPMVVGRMSFSMVLAIPLFVLGAALWFGFGAAPHANHEPTALKARGSASGPPRHE